MSVLVQVSVPGVSPSPQGCVSEQLWAYRGQRTGITSHIPTYLFHQYPCQLDSKVHSAQRQKNPVVSLFTCHPSIHPSFIKPFNHPSIHPSIHHPSTDLSILHPFIYPSIHNVVWDHFKGHANGSWVPADRLWGRWSCG